MQAKEEKRKPVFESSTPQLQERKQNSSLIGEERDGTEKKGFLF
jgi:hypothetical protein